MFSSIWYTKLCRLLITPPILVTSEPMDNSWHKAIGCITTQTLDCSWHKYGQCDILARMNTPLRMLVGSCLPVLIPDFLYFHVVQQYRNANLIMYIYKHFAASQVICFLIIRYKRRKCHRCVQMQNFHSKKAENIEDDFVVMVALKCAWEFSNESNSISFLMTLDYFPGRQIAMDSVLDYKNACHRGGDEETLFILVKHRTNIKGIWFKSLMFCFNMIDYII